MKKPPTLPSLPDFSPASVTLSLLTLTDLSPSRPFDIKLQNPYDLGQSVWTVPFLPQNSLILYRNRMIRAKRYIVTSIRVKSKFPSVFNAKVLITWAHIHSHPKCLVKWELVGTMYRHARGQMPPGLFV
ncbi:hypothetical protein M378DRAFT_17414 [Amanita muscaria Koide BX008]|uniref:Uncharacterized protein n=1 Tax=Amanita muscaria (strain Koide BX008) TaxID=946122 RepID=A0A0C2SQ15_AMAMK|nr:hypothetical protein M378DRAFT_17414 [Amanita muscaria Koide BX008]